jgi:hypothetical protein
MYLYLQSMLLAVSAWIAKGIMGSQAFSDILSQCGSLGEQWAVRGQSTIHGAYFGQLGMLAAISLKKSKWKADNC